LTTEPASPLVFWFKVGISAATKALNVAEPLLPFGAAYIWLAVLEPERLVAVVALPDKAPTNVVEVIEVAPVTTPASILIVSSIITAEPAVGLSFKLPVVLLTVFPSIFTLSTCKAVRYYLAFQYYH